MEKKDANWPTMAVARNPPTSTKEARVPSGRRRPPSLLMDSDFSKGRKLGSHFSIKVTGRLWSQSVHYGTQLLEWAAPATSQSACAYTVAGK